MTFEELGLSPELLSAIKDAGYSEPTPIQAGAIPHAVAGKDVLGIAQTGTGKTASFTLPLIEKLSRGRAKARMPRSLIICPTRELAAQVASNFETYAKNHKLNMALLIGGVAFGPQEDILNHGADVLIATPGRLLDHFERGKLLLTGVQLMVVDEADRMLDMGFIPDLERIFSLTPPRRQTLFFSATMPKEIQSLVKKFLKDPVRVEVSRPATTASTVTQWRVDVNDKAARAKRDALRAAMRREEVRNGIIFCNRKRDVDIVARSLKRHGFSAAPIHGDLAQSERTATLENFKTGELRFLVASDVAARGLDIPDVSHVFNFDVPHQSDDYVHRIGRTGRAGRTGESVTLVAPGDEKSMAAVQKLIGQDIPLLPLEGVSEETAKPKSSRRPKSEDKQAADDGQPAPDSAPETVSRESGEDAGGRRRRSRSSARTDDTASSKSSDKSGSSSEPRTDGKSGGRRRKSGGDQDGAPVVGFGEHLPAFMRED